MSFDPKAVRARCEAATPPPMRIGIYDPERDPVELFRENLEHGEGHVWTVSAPEHPESIGGWDPRPDLAIIVANTGNGPTSKANAVFIEHAYADLPAALDEIERLRAVLLRARKRLDTYENCASACHVRHRLDHPPVRGKTVALIEAIDAALKGPE